MLIDTDTLRAAVAAHFDAYRVTEAEIAGNLEAYRIQLRQDDDRVAAIDALGEAEAVARRYAALDPSTAGDLLTRLYAFLCAHTGGGNETRVDLRHPNNEPNQLRAEFEDTFRAYATRHGVKLELLDGPKP